MSLKKNIFANYISQIYVTFIGIVMVPLYLKYMGAEAYGLVGFFAMLQAWFNVLDIGLTPTMARETARFRGGATNSLSYLRLVRALQTIFLAVAFAGGFIMFTSAGFIASDWLNVRELPLNEVKFAVQMMAIGMALRWMAGLYRATISGCEQQVWLGKYNIIIATLRFVGVLLVLMYIGTTPTAFFSYQLLVAVTELICLTVKSHELLPSVSVGQRLGWSIAPIKPVLKFSITIAFSSLVWVLVRQTDKLVLSKMLPLAEYGYFTLAVLVAGVVMITSGPISGAIIPRLARLEAQGDHAGLIKLYQEATQMVCVIALPVAFTMAAFAEQVLWAWTGDPVIAKSTAPILKLYLVGNGIMTVSAFPYYLQFAKGDLRLHMIGNAIFVTVLIPSIVFATWKFGGVGAGWSWLLSNLVYFLGWIPLVHNRIEQGLHMRWIMQDVLPMFVVAGGVACAASMISLGEGSRVHIILQAMLLGLVVLTLTSLASQRLRERVLLLMRRVSFR